MIMQIFVLIVAILITYYLTRYQVIKEANRRLLLRGEHRRKSIELHRMEIKFFIAKLVIALLIMCLILRLSQG
ncbi:hypothetical protein SG34_011945 [Thalassomonas viridans]|uniref:Uncharacterized protein n=1 Tax=Thalassomonas viridans TaxID=137584 RepID=A0AAE9Z7F8_9GAMM|nr:hypothetical protein [Thalassomonas viridans]WDE07524.1 hypothetical protein SG34_011945 [Thalassomonas viridans]